MKRILALLLAISLCICMMSGISFAAEGEEPEAADLGMVADLAAGLLDLDAAGSLIAPAVQVNVTIVCEGEPVFPNYPVRVMDVDGDGAITIADTLKVTHEMHYPVKDEEDNGFALSSENWIIKLWGVENGGGYGYYLNNVAAWSVLDEVKDGDYLAAYVYTDSENWSDIYTYFTETEVDCVRGGEVALQLMGWGYDEEWNPVNMPIEGAIITIDGEDTEYVTDAEGRVIVGNFGEDDYYLVSARSDDMILVSPVCDVNIYEAGIAANFTDISGHWAEKDIARVADLGYLVGVTETEFAPNAPVTRAMLVTVLYRIEGEPEAKSAASFTDIPADAWYAAPVAWAAENGIAMGYNDGSFRPNDALTRQDAAMLVYRWVRHIVFDVIGLDLVTELMNEMLSELSEEQDFAEIYEVFVGEEMDEDIAVLLTKLVKQSEDGIFTVNEDVLKRFEDEEKVAEWGTEAMSWVISNGIITGVTEETIAPLKTLTRAQLATMLSRIF